MYQVIGPIKQTKKQKAYCKKLGIHDINKVEITCSYYCPHCGQTFYEEDEVSLDMGPQPANP